MMNWILAHGSLTVLVLFFSLFIIFGFWAFRPRNRDRMDEYGQIPLRENDNDQS